MPASFDQTYHIHPREDKNSVSSGESTNDDMSPLTSRKVSATEELQSDPMGSRSEQHQDDFDQQKKIRHHSTIAQGSIRRFGDMFEYQPEASTIRHKEARFYEDQGARQHPHKHRSLPLETTKSNDIVASNASDKVIPRDYKGFHRPGTNETIPPLSRPLKNKQKKSLFGKFLGSINEKKKERPSDSSIDLTGFDHPRHGSVSSTSTSVSSSVSSGNNKPISRVSHAASLRDQASPTNTIFDQFREHSATSRQGTFNADQHQFHAIPMDHHNPSVSTSSATIKTNLNESPFLGDYTDSVVTLNLDDLNDMAGIVSQGPRSTKSRTMSNSSHRSQLSNISTSSGSFSSKNISGTAPLSPTTKLAIVKESWSAPESWDVKPPSKDEISAALENVDDEYVIRKNYTAVTQLEDANLLKKRAYHIKIIGEDDDFTSTLKRPYDESVDELIKYLKSRFSLAGDYKLSLMVGKVTKKLDGNQRPIKIQTNLLLLAGYLETDNLEDIGRNDLSYLFKFILNRDILKQLSPQEEEHILKDLAHLNLKSKDLQKIPAFCYSSKVQSLDVSNNGDISIPSDFFQMPECQLNSLRMVNIRTKTFPPNVVYAKELISLDLERNFISHIPTSIYRLHNLSIMTLSCNKLKDLPKLPPNLKILDLSSNEFETYPETLNNLKNLLQLDLSYNKLRELPKSIESLKSLKKLNISSNYLKHFSPKMKELRTLNLRHNDILTLDLHESNIENLYLTNNNISNIANPLPNLKTLDLHLNPITQLNILSSNLATLSLSKAKLTSLSPLILSFVKLEKLELSRNALRELPDLSSLTNLRELSIYSNNLDTLPDFSALTKLRILDVHDNNLKAIPDVSFIESLNISSNLISEFPFPKSDKLLYLRAADNQLSDDCFYVIKNFTKLKLLSLSYNKIFEIPTGTLSKCTALDQLFLSGNFLTSLPDDFDLIESLRLLFINGNKFRTLPSDLSHFESLELIDVGSNDLKYNTSNSKYEWNWKDNHNLRYLNLSGNTKMEITEDLNLPKLKSLGLMDLTITTQTIPDETTSMRVRTTPTTLGNNISYGYSDRIYKQIVVRDSVHENICGGVLIGLFDGINSGSISHIIREEFHKTFEFELKKNMDDIVNALRQTFLSLNSIIYHSELSSEDGLTGSTVTVIFIKDKKVYTANIGDTTCMLAKPDGSYTYLTVKHSPSSTLEFERIRTSGGFVSSNDKVDGVAQVSRAAGFIDLSPHLHTGPDISEVALHDEVLVMGTKELFEFIPTNTIGDMVREYDNPMRSAEKLRDYAISYGCSSRLSVIVVSAKKEETKKKTGRLSRQIVEDSNLRRLKPEIEPPIGELAMVFTDIKNSTALWENYPLAMRSAIRTHNEMMRRQLHIVGGYEVKTEGDAFMVSFPSVTTAMIWCFNVQQQLLQEDWPSEIIQSDEGRSILDNDGVEIYKGLSVRMGIHWGTPVCEPDIITRRMDYFGPMVNKAARVCAVADGGEITLTLDCVKELQRIEDAFNAHHHGGVDVEDAFGNGENSEILDHEFATVKNIGWRLERLGKVQLKGLETEEEISIIFPRQLQSRYKFQKQPDFTSDDLHVLRILSLRLDAILSKVNGVPFEMPSKMKNIDHADKNFFELFTSRIENTIALLILINNTVGLMNKGDLFDLVKELSSVYNKSKGLLDR